MNSGTATIGPYIVHEPLGRGGMGVVYRAQHRDSGEFVAVKTISVSNLNLVQGIRREIRALVRLSHPGIVRIVAEGIQSDVPWYAMELLEGQTLRGYLRDLRFGSQPSIGQGPELKDELTASAFEQGQLLVKTDRWWTESIQFAATNSIMGNELTAISEGQLTSDGRMSGRRNQSGVLPVEKMHHLLTITRRLCSVLAYLHGQGIIHCDLKPDNIFIKPDGMPVLVDFGLMASFSGGARREDLSIDIGGSGTVKYMAPEQIKGELLDARVDLYALGCILYEMLSGQTPFQADSINQILVDHICKPVQPISEIIAGVPAELEELLEGLLQKEPQKRIGYASDVVRILEKLGAGDGYSVSGPPAQIFLFRSRLAGRATSLQTVSQKMEMLRSSQGGMVMIGGESGVGKTRFALEIGKIATLDRLTVITGESKELVARPLEPFRALLLAIADYCRERGLEEADRILGRKGKVLATYEPGLRDVPGQQKYPAPEPLPADGAKLRLFSYLFEAIEHFARARELVIILDDLQWADELSLEFLDFLAQEHHLEDRPVLLIGIHRIENMPPVLDSILTCSGVVCLVLERLEVEAISAIISDMLAIPAAPPYFSQFLTKNSEGNPYFVTEYLRAAVERGILDRDEKGHWHFTQTRTGLDHETDLELLPLPHSLRELINQRLAGLSTALLTITHIAAVIGREATLAVLQEAVAVQEGDLFDGLDELNRRYIFEKSSTGIIRFAHDKIREVVYAGLEPAIRIGYHLRVAQTMEKVYQMQLEGHFAELGYHYDMSGKSEKARFYYLRGARKATEHYAYVEAEQLYQAYFRLVTDPTLESIAARSAFGQRVLMVLCKYDQVISQHQSGVQEARSLADQVGEAKHNLDLGITYFRIGEVDLADEYYQRAMLISRTTGDIQLEGMILSNHAGLKLEQNYLDEALSMFEQALLLHRQTHDRSQEGKTLSNLAILYNEMRRIEKVPELYKQALVIHREQGNRRSEGITLYNLAAYYHELGDIHQARELYEQALEIAHEIGNTRSEGLILSNLAGVYLLQGDLEQSLDLSERSLVLHRQAHNRRGQALTLSNMADIYIEWGQFEKGQMYHEQALALSREVNDRYGERHSLGELANIKKVLGLFDEARILLEKALDLAKEIGDLRGQGRTIGDIASLLLEQGAIIEGYHSYQQALDVTRNARDFEFQGQFLIILAALERRLNAHYRVAEKMLDEARQILDRHQVMPALGLAICEQGHLSLARGRSPQSSVEQFESLIERYGPDQNLRLQQARSNLEQARDAFEKGYYHLLFRGELVQAIPLPFRTWLQQKGLLTH